MPRLTAISEIGLIWFVYVQRFAFDGCCLLLHLIHENKTTFYCEFNKCTQIKNNNNNNKQKQK